MADLTRFDFHVVRFMNSETVERMSCEEVGQYVLLLCKAWLLGKEASLPDDLPYLAKQARSRKLSPLVLEKFPIIQTSEGSRRRNDILYGEWLLARDRQASASERGKKGNEVRYSESNSDDVAMDQAVSSSSPIPFQSTPSHSNPNQTKNSVSFTGGSFGQGDFKNVSARWWAYFKKQIQKSKQNKQQYAEACSTHGEQAVLDYMEMWAKDNQWVASHPRGGNRLYVFLQALPEMIAGDEISIKAVQKVNSQDLVLAQRMQEAMRREQEQEAKEAEKRKKDKAFEEENRDNF
jgi:uncharacterized protein YdaU (DUF1376 family)